ncbi:MAG: PAS domain-containing protein, partial [Dehalococcoidia bacterium]
ERAAELKRANQQLEQEKAELVKAIEGSGGPGGQLGEAEEGTAAEPGRAGEQLQEELRVRESAMALLVDAIATAQPDGKLTYVNQSFLDMWGCDSDAEILGEPFAGLWQSEEQAQTVLETLLGGEGWKGELAARRKDDSTFDVELSASMVTDENDTNICVVASIVDLTERRQVEEKLKEFERKFSVLATKSVEWAERLSGVLEDLQEPAGELAEATDGEARGEAVTTVEDAGPDVAEAEAGEPVDAEDLEEGAGPVEAEDAGVDDAELLGTTEATDRKVVEAEDIEEAGDTIGEGPETVQAVVEELVEGENDETVEAEAVGMADPESNEAASDEGSGETASVNSGLIDIKIDEAS